MIKKTAYCNNENKQAIDACDKKMRIDDPTIVSINHVSNGEHIIYHRSDYDNEGEVKKTEIDKMILTEEEKAVLRFG